MKHVTQVTTTMQDNAEDQGSMNMTKDYTSNTARELIIHNMF
jgi:hypothetical protein